MNIAIIGAGAGIGLEAVNQALVKGYNVTALSTNISSIVDHPLITKIQGTAVNAEDLKKAMKGADALLITVGTKQKKNTTLFSSIAKALVIAATETNFNKPVLVITGFGAGDSKPYTGFFIRTVIRLLLKDQYEDKSIMEQIITASNINWEIIRPGILGNGPATGQYEVLTNLQKGMKVGKINRADVAGYLIREAVQPVNLKRNVTLT